MSIHYYVVMKSFYIALAFIGSVFAAPEPNVSVESNAQLKDYQALHALVKNPKPIMWVITGDSITHGCMHTKNGRSYPEHWMERVKWEMRRIHDTVVNTGVSGDTCTGLLKGFNDRVGMFKPQVVSINFGMNDATKAPAGSATFRVKLAEIVKKVRSIGAIPILQVPSLTLETDPARIKLREEMSDVVREVAKKDKVLLVDHESFWMPRVGEMPKRKEWMNDPIHPNAIGHRYMFIKMAQDLGFYDEKSPVCKES